MRLLIAGWHGQVARALMEAAPSAADVKTLAVGRPALDVRDPRSIERVFSDVAPTIAINSAAYTAVDQAEGESERAFALNVDGAALFARAAARRNIPIIHLSTHYVFDGAKPTPYVEADTPRPLTVYGRSKLAGEHAVAKENPHHIILRTSWVFSAKAGSFTAKILQSAATGERLRMVDDQRGNPTFAPHLATAILEIARKISADGDASPWGTYHAAGTGSASWYELATEVMRGATAATAPAATIDRITSAEYPARTPRPANSELCCDKLDHTFGVALPSWREGVKDCLAQIQAR